ncbi:unnamed protein product [Anisakis simplex]|uniref:Ovule protein n=1 Tax=Anisakis simplex TaxID=6269 RepID=A0A0M3J8U8_ANISI|nr:unnamed protein product [Anisakis simplex]
MEIAWRRTTVSAMKDGMEMTVRRRRVNFYQTVVHMVNVYHSTNAYVIHSIKVICSIPSLFRATNLNCSHPLPPLVCH